MKTEIKDFGIKNGGKSVWDHLVEKGPFAPFIARDWRTGEEIVIYGCSFVEYKFTAFLRESSMDEVKEIEVKKRTPKNHWNAPYGHRGRNKT